VFLLFAAVIGILVGVALGGRFQNLGRLPLRWNVLVFLALALQVLTFTPLNVLPWSLVPALYLLSNGLAAAWVIRNLRVAGMPLIALGALSNLLAIVANGGRMPVDRALLARTRGEAFAEAVAGGRMPTNAVIANSHTHLIWLTDRLALPAPLPAPVVWSVGDLLIAAGVIWLIAAGMRREQVRSDQKAAA
jgi:hypothetical protein